MPFAPDAAGGWSCSSFQRVALSTVAARGSLTQAVGLIGLLGLLLQLKILKNIS
jgi:hypothetical protein